MNYVIIKKSTYDSIRKYAENSTDTKLEQIKIDLNDVERQLEVMDIDAITGIIGNDGVEVLKNIKAIMQDGKIGIGDTAELWNLGIRLIKIYNKAKSIKEEIKDISINEIEILIIEVFELYKLIVNKNPKLIGALPKA